MDKQLCLKCRINEVGNFYGAFCADCQKIVTEDVARRMDIQQLSQRFATDLGPDEASKNAEEEDNE